MKIVSTQRNSKNCIICGMENPNGLKAPFYNLEDGSLATVITFKNSHQSYPDRTHGGMVSALLDELMGRTLWVTDPTTFGVTTTLEITYRRPVPLDTKVKARAIITFNSPRGLTAKGRIYSMDGTLLAEGKAKYFKIPFERAFNNDTTYHSEMCYEIPLDITEIDFPEFN